MNNNPEFDLKKFKAKERLTALQYILQDAERRKHAAETAECIKTATTLKYIRDVEERTGSKNFRL